MWATAGLVARHSLQGGPLGGVVVGVECGRADWVYGVGGDGGLFCSWLLFLDVKFFVLDRSSVEVSLLVRL